jgi:hypothetical protein
MKSWTLLLCIAALTGPSGEFLKISVEKAAAATFSAALFLCIRTSLSGPVAL